MLHIPAAFLYHIPLHLHVHLSKGTPGALVTRRRRRIQVQVTLKKLALIKTGQAAHLAVTHMYKQQNGLQYCIKYCRAPAAARCSTAVSTIRCHVADPQSTACAEAQHDCNTLVAFHPIPTVHLVASRHIVPAHSTLSMQPSMSACNGLLQPVLGEVADLLCHEQGTNNVQHRVTQ